MFDRRLAPTGVVCIAFLLSPAIAASQQPSAVIQIVVTADDRPVPRAQIVVRGNTTEADAEGRAILQVPPGPVEITVVKEGFNPVTVSATASIGQPQIIPIALERQTAIEEHVTVSATRTELVGR